MMLANDLVLHVFTVWEAELKPNKSIKVAEHSFRACFC